MQLGSKIERENAIYDPYDSSFDPLKPDCWSRKECAEVLIENPHLDKDKIFANTQAAIKSTTTKSLKDVNSNTSHRDGYFVVDTAQTIAEKQHQEKLKNQIRDHALEKLAIARDEISDCYDHYSQEYASNNSDNDETNSNSNDSASGESESSNNVGNNSGESSCNNNVGNNSGDSYCNNSNVANNSGEFSNNSSANNNNRQSPIDYVVEQQATEPMDIFDPDS